MEIWKDLYGYEDRYEISSWGRIGIKERIGHHPKGGIHQFKIYPKIMSACLDKYGYLTIVLTNVSGPKTFKVHRLVAMSFMKELYFPGAQINHKNKIRSDNMISNLEWCTGKHNVRHSYLNGRNKPIGERNGASKIGEKDILEIRKLYKDGMLQRDIASKFSITQSNVSAIIRRKSWPHV